jgi:uncharacterized membrane protein (DUF106 family)
LSEEASNVPARDVQAKVNRAKEKKMMSREKLMMFLHTQISLMLTIMLLVIILF